MSCETPGINKGMLLRTLSIDTVGLPAWKRYKVWLFEQRRVVLEEPFHAPRPNGGSYILPAGFVFDGGSIPRWLLVLIIAINIVFPVSGWVGNICLSLVLVGLLIERFGLMLVAFAVHDFSVRYGLMVTGDGVVEVVPSVKAANRIMRKVNFATNDMKTLGWIAHAAVMLGAGRAWRRYRKGLLVADTSWTKHDYGVHIRPSDY